MTRQMMIGQTPIGGGAPVTIQSMTNTDSCDVEATLRQIRRLHAAGCDIIRVSVYNEQAARAARDIVDGSPIPVVADIHFDYRLAIAALESGCAKVRVNPGNMGGEKGLAELAACLKAHHAPVRVGVNGGSLDKDLVEKYGVTGRALAESALREARLLEKHGVSDMVISVKASDVLRTVEACREVARLCDYPQHIGVTEAGTVDTGRIKSAVGIGALLLDGIGDTIRVSLSGDPEPEVETGLEILRAVGLRTDHVEITSCPTCGRTTIDVEGIARRVREATKHIRVPIRAAVMGCIVNGPGEAKDADVGIAGGREGGALFKNGQPAGAVKGDLAQALIDEIIAMANERKA
ncbi:MAG: flavodoxin-dependent (E)-4-hydroxy-3-methylbut-2-enyl-diphosphate synthase [Eubacteriales bacterium]|nr:flavodoxin-dependent (E)-4-hydroxy-3-methylbut-2-enyl-diphosphate synthase [Eubacteriales bacterium]